MKEFDSVEIVNTMKIFKHKKITYIFLAICIFFTFLCIGCSKKDSILAGADEQASVSLPESPVPASVGSVKGSRDNTPKVLTPIASGETTFKCDVATLDASNIKEGYVIVTYTGSSKKVKLQITGSNNITYTYNLTNGPEVFPLSAGSGNYTVAVYENTSGNQYATAMSESISVTITNLFGPFLYPNQYVNFNASSNTVKRGTDLAKGANSDLDVVSNIYNFVIRNITYDYDKAETVQSGYIPDVDVTLSSKKGICLDYAALMSAMLRSQRIPTRLEVGYAGDAYHAWISTYIKDVGWVNGIIQFDGKSWALMDPTFAANSSEKALKNFIGNGSNYTTKYIY